MVNREAEKAEKVKEQVEKLDGEEKTVFEAGDEKKVEKEKETVAENQAVVENQAIAEVQAVAENGQEQEAGNDGIIVDDVPAQQPVADVAPDVRAEADNEGNVQQAVAVIGAAPDVGAVANNGQVGGLVPEDDEDGDIIFVREEQGDGQKRHPPPYTQEEVQDKIRELTHDSMLARARIQEENVRLGGLRARLLALERVLLLNEIPLPPGPAPRDRVAPPPPVPPPQAVPRPTPPPKDDSGEEGDTEDSEDSEVEETVDVKEKEVEEENQEVKEETDDVEGKKIEEKEVKDGVNKKLADAKDEENVEVEKKEVEDAKDKVIQDIEDKKIEEEKIEDDKEKEPAGDGEPVVKKPKLG